MRSKNPELMKTICSYAERFFLREGRYPSTTQIAEAVGISIGTAYKYLEAMNENGMIRYDGSSIVTDVTEKYEGRRCGAPILGSIPCGDPLDEEENVEAIVTLPEFIFGGGDLFLLRANGDSMIQAGIEDGDLVVLERKNTAKEGDIVAALVDGSTSTLKRYHVDSRTGRAVLLPENDAYEPIVPAVSLEIQGVARNVIRSI